MDRRENTFKKYLMSVMGRQWDAQSHEDMYSDGIADLSFGMEGINGWIELKHIPKWPMKENTLVKPKHYTAIQVNWLISRWKKGGNCFVFVKVGKDEYFLFHALIARSIRHGMTRFAYEQRCIMYWRGSVNAKELKDRLLFGAVLNNPPPYSHEHCPDDAPLSEP